VGAGQISSGTPFCRINAAFHLTTERRIYAAAKNSVVRPVEWKGKFGLSFLAQIGDKQTMNSRELIETEFPTLPAPLQGEGCDFARFRRSEDAEEHFSGLGGIVPHRRKRRQGRI